MRDRLQTLAKTNEAQRGRLLGLAAAGIIENRDLFPDVECSALTEEMNEVLDSEGDSWSVGDRVLFLDALGRLDQFGGDPRLRHEKWVDLASVGVGIHFGRLPPHLELGFSWAPVTIQEYKQFLSDPDWQSAEHWIDVPEVSRVTESLKTAIQRQGTHPNRPVTGVGIYGAMAYCKWRTSHRMDDAIVRLPTVSEWLKLVGRAPLKDISRSTAVLTGDQPAFNFQGAGLHCPSPVGAFPLKVAGAVDVLGNVWEWLLPSGGAVTDHDDVEEGVPVGGASYEVELRYLQHRNRSGEATRGWLAHAPYELSLVGFRSIGFRCVLARTDVPFSGLRKAHYRPPRSRRGKDGRSETRQ